MVNEPVKAIIDHGLTMVDHSQKTNSTIIDHDQPTMVDHGQSVVALTTMTMVINDGLNEWVDHGQNTGFGYH